MAAAAAAGSAEVESIEDPALEARILEFMKEQGTQLVSMQAISEKLGARAVGLLNLMLRRGTVQAFTEKGGYFVRFADEGHKKFLGLTKDDLLVQQIIQDSGSHGIWTRELRNKSGLDEKKLNKCLKTLENRQIIKKVKTVAAAKKNIWMMFDIEPDRSLTGGAWYSDEQEFEDQFVVVLGQLCFDFLKTRATEAHRSPSPLERLKRSYTRLEDIKQHVESTKVSNVALAADDIVAIMDTLLYDGKVEGKPDPQNAGFFMYKLARSPNSSWEHNTPAGAMLTPGSAPLLSTPCGTCPVFDNCFEGGVVSPSTCPYLNEWLDF